MKNIKGNVFCGIIILVFMICIIPTFSESRSNQVNQAYQVYLDGEKIGLINDKEKLYNLINKEQAKIKDKYDINQVYPPKGFEIMPNRTYNSEISSIQEIYDEIKENRDFTIKGYEIIIKPKEDKDKEKEEPKILNVLSKEIFEEAMDLYIKTFVTEEQYEAYIKNEQEEIKNIGKIIDNMFIDETITIKEAYISTEDEIFTNSSDLVKKLLFGDNTEIKEYTVKEGDSLEKIAYNNKLNVSEIIIANEIIKDENTLLAIGQKINISLIDPQITLIYDLEVKEIIEKPFETEKKYDSSKYAGYVKVETPGINGLNRITKQVRAINGEMNQDAYIDESATEVLRVPQNKVVIYGNKITSSGNYVDTGAMWAHPTNFPYVVTSEYGYRWGTIHDGIDISGTGYGSPIYAILEGEVINAGWGGIAGSSAGNNVVIKHPNGYYSIYAHMNYVKVAVGQKVSRKQILGGMGDTGFVSGTHLHLGVFIGLPYNGGYPVNPRTIIKF